MVNYLCDPEDVRGELGLDHDDAPDDVINRYIIKAQKDLLKDIAYFMREEDLSGNIDGSNTTFTTSETYIADRDFDGIVNSLDVYAYAWTDKDDPATKSSVAVGVVYGDYGKIVLASAPATSVEKITANYYYYEAPADTLTIPDAVAILSAYYFAQREILLMPNQWMHGAYRFMKSGEYKGLLIDYYKKVDEITGVASYRGEHDAPTFIRGEDV